MYPVHLGTQLNQSNPGVPSNGGTPLKVLSIYFAIFSFTFVVSFVASL